MEIQKKQIDFLLQKFNNSQGKNNLKKIEDEEIKLIYYGLFFDSYQEVISNQKKFIYLNNIDVYLDSEINTLMIYYHENQKKKKIIFETPHYSIINYIFPSEDWKLLKVR